MYSDNDYIATTFRSNRWNNEITEFSKFNKGGSIGKSVGKVTDFVGLTDYKGQEKAQSQAASYAKKSSKQANQALDLAKENLAITKEGLTISKENLAFMKQQYADWQGVYGDIEKNLGDYYKNLSGSSLAAKHLSASAKEYSNALATTQQTLAQRGLSASGLAAATETAMGMQNAVNRANIRANQDEMANQQKAGFLSMGLGQKGMLLSGIANASGQVSNSMGLIGNATGLAGQATGQIMQGYQYQAGQQTQIGQNLYDANQSMKSGLIGGLMQSPSGQGMMNSAAGGISSGISSIGSSFSGLGGLFSDVRLKNNIRKIGQSRGINIYEWEWNNEAHNIGANTQPNIGVLAQEVQHLGVVCRNTNGYLMVDYNKLGDI